MVIGNWFVLREKYSACSVGWWLMAGADFF
jgi:hypothetical protein